MSDILIPYSGRYFPTPPELQLANAHQRHRGSSSQELFRHRWLRRANLPPGAPEQRVDGQRRRGPRLRLGQHLHFQLQLPERAPLRQCRHHLEQHLQRSKPLQRRNFEGNVLRWNPRRRRQRRLPGRLRWTSHPQRTARRRHLLGLRLRPGQIPRRLHWCRYVQELDRLSVRFSRFFTVSSEIKEKCSPLSMFF